MLSHTVIRCSKGTSAPEEADSQEERGRMESSESLNDPLEKRCKLKEEKGAVVPRSVVHIIIHPFSIPT